MNIAKTLAAGLLAGSIAFAAEGDTAKKNNVSVGVRAAFNYNMMYGLDDDWNVYADDADAPSGIGFEGGIALKLQVLPFMQFTPEILFNYGSLSQDDGDIERDFTQMGIEIPLLLRVNPVAGVFLTVGPTFEFSVSDKEEIDFGTMTNGAGSFTHKFDEGFDRKAFQFGLTLGAGYNITDHFYADFRMNLGLTDVYEGESALVSLDGGKQMTIKFGLGYWFI